MRGGQSHLKLPDANTAAVVYMDTGIDDIQGMSMDTYLH